MTEVLSLRAPILYSPTQSPIWYTHTHARIGFRLPENKSLMTFTCVFIINTVTARKNVAYFESCTYTYCWEL